MVCLSRRGLSPKLIATFLSDEVHRPQCGRDQLIAKPNLPSERQQDSRTWWTGWHIRHSSLAEEIVRWFFWCCRPSRAALAGR